MNELYKLYMHIIYPYIFFFLIFSPTNNTLNVKKIVPNLYQKNKKSTQLASDPTTYCTKNVIFCISPDTPCDRIIYAAAGRTCKLIKPGKSFLIFIITLRQSIAQGCILVKS